MGIGLNGVSGAPALSVVVEMEPSLEEDLAPIQLPTMEEKHVLGQQQISSCVVQASVRWVS
jgi:hypothetical protein